MSTWKIAAVQMDCQIGEVERNLQAIRDRLRRAASTGAQLVVFPECVLTGYAFESLAEARPFAQPLPGPASEVLAADCKELDTFAIVGLLERDGDKIFNTAL